jgi:hypothetical protein
VALLGKRPFLQSAELVQWIDTHTAALAHSALAPKNTLSPYLETPHGAFSNSSGRGPNSCEGTSGYQWGVRVNPTKRTLANTLDVDVQIRFLTVCICMPRVCARRRPDQASLIKSQALNF